MCGLLTRVCKVLRGITQSVDNHLSSVMNKLTSLECSLNEQTLNVEIIYKYL